MDLAAAMRLANQKSTTVTSNGKVSCPKKKTGLIVLVYGGAENDALKGISVRVDGKKKSTDKNGLASYVPLKQGDYVVTAKPPNDDHISPTDAPVNVPLGGCPVLAVHIPVGVVPKIKLQWEDDKSAVPNSEVTLTERGDGSGYSWQATTNSSGVATKQNPLVPPYRYDATAKYGGVVATIYRDGGQVVGFIDLADSPEQTFYLRRRSMKFRVQKQVGTTTTELAGAKVKLGHRALEATAALVSAEAVLEFKSIILPDSETTCPVAQLTPDGTDDVYEVVEVTSV